MIILSMYDIFKDEEALLDEMMITKMRIGK